VPTTQHDVQLNRRTSSHDNRQPANGLLLLARSVMLPLLLPLSDAATAAAAAASRSLIFD
jgi:hypothetical protein